MTTPSETECPGYGLLLPTTDGPIDPYANSSPGCPEELLAAIDTDQK